MTFLRGIALLLLTATSPLLHGQKGALNFEPTVGLAFPILSSGSGLYAGSSLEYRLNKALALETHIAYTRVKITRAFLGSSGGNVEQTIGLYGGLRVYLLGARSKTSLYFNALAGPMSLQERNPSTGPDVSEVDLSVTLGLMLRIKPVFFGVAVGPNEYVVLRAGGSFPLSQPPKESKR